MGSCSSSSRAIQRRRQPDPSNGVVILSRPKDREGPQPPIQRQILPRTLLSFELRLHRSKPHPHPFELPSNKSLLTSTPARVTLLREIPTPLRTNPLRNTLIFSSFHTPKNRRLQPYCFQPLAHSLQNNGGYTPLHPISELARRLDAYAPPNSVTSASSAVNSLPPPPSPKQHAAPQPALPSSSVAAIVIKSLGQIAICRVPP